MKRFVLLAAFPIFLTSCFSVSFFEPQPIGVENLSAFPDKLIGNYIGFDDTISITPKSYTKEGNTCFISDSVVVRKFKKYYVLSLLEKRNWTVLIAEPQKNGDLTMYSISDDDHEDGSKCDTDSLITEMKKICEVKKMDQQYFANPSKREFKKLINKGIFRHMGDLKRMD